MKPNTPLHRLLQSFTSLRNFGSVLTDLREGLDREGTIVEIKKNRRMHGANAWMLMCSIMIASLGLDLNSPAVIIGAMLISPLMSPILGVGLAVGMNDTETLRTSLYHFLLAIGIALVTSTVYFWLTPFGEETQEILSRTRPTLLDVLIATFGGTAGIISISRKDKTNAIPGVAIATALMPPLCVSGFGIATGNTSTALNAFFLFFLNTFFVALSTYFIVRLLKFPKVSHLDEEGEKRKAWLVSIFTLLMLIPSTVLMVGVLQEARLNKHVDEFVKGYFESYMKYVDGWHYVHSDTLKSVIVKVYRAELPDSMYLDYEDDMAHYGLYDMRLEIIPTSEIDLQDLQSLRSEIATQITETGKIQRDRNRLVDSLLEEHKRMRQDTISFAGISQELKAIFPDLQYCAFARAQSSDFEVYRNDEPILVISWPSAKSSADRRRDEDKMRTFLEERLDIAHITIIRK